MTHYLTIKGNKFSVEMGCNHPDLKHNSCPTQGGDCENCQYGVCTMKIKDALRLFKAARVTLK